MSETSFKKCPSCQKDWPTQDDFMSDKELQINGYTADFENLECGLFFFTHNVIGCHSTMAIEARKFFDLHHGPQYIEKRTAGEECPKYCLKKESLKRCDAECECAFVRDVIQTIREMQRGNSS